jgi:hypothetical protein
MHEWGDEDFNWQEFNKVLEFFWERSQKYRIGGQIKEKYGTLRWYAVFSLRGLHDIFWPGHVYFYRYRQPTSWNKYIRWAQPVLQYPLMWIDRLLKNCNWLQRVIREYQVKKYIETYEIAIKKWPEFTKEIMMMADHQELLKDLFPFEKYWNLEKPESH